MLTPDSLYLLPKAELHLHLEGAIPLPFLADLINRNSPDQRTTPSELESGYVFRNFGEFVSKWMWTVSQFQSETDFCELVKAVAHSLSKQNIVHAELFFSPFDYPPGGLAAERIAEEVIKGAEFAMKETGVSLLFFADIVRNHGHETAVTRVERLIPYKNSIFIGIGLGGSETGFPNEGFIPAFSRAREAGFRVVAHSGETQGAGYVESAVNGLKAERIGHGVRCLEDQNVVKLLKDKQIPLEVCPVSNLKTGVISSIENHPIRQLVDAGLFVTLNSDDPTYFSTNLNNEIRVLHEELGFSADEILELLKNNFKASFLPEPEKEKWLKVISGK